MCQLFYKQPGFYLQIKVIYRASIYHRVSLVFCFDESTMFIQKFSQVCVSFTDRRSATSQLTSIL